MRWIATPTLLVLTLVASALGADADLEKLQGRWMRTSEIKDGKPSPEAVVSKTSLTLEGEKYILTIGEEKRTGTVKLDSSKSIKTIDILSGDGPNKGKTLLGIYSLDGDTFTYCLAPPGKDRPTKLASEAGSGYMLYVNKRAR